MKIERIVVLAALVAMPAGVHAQKQPVSPADYGKWETPGAAVLSPNGHWFAYTISRVNEESELRIRPVARDTTVVVPYGSGAQFTGDSRWLAYSIGIPAAEREKLTAEKKPIRSDVAIRSIDASTTTRIEDVASFRFSPDARYIALRAYAPEGKRGADLIIRNLANGVSVNFGNVGEFAWAPNGSLMAMAVETESEAGNGIQLYDAATGTMRVLDSSPSKYRTMSWRDKSRDLVVLRTVADTGFRDTTHVALAWTGVGTSAERKHEITNDMRISEARPPQWSLDGAMVTLGLRPRVPADTAKKKSTDKISDVQVWRGGDVRIIPEQKAQEQQDLRRTLLAAWQVRDNRIVVIGTQMLESAQLLKGGRWATETDRSRYTAGNMFGRPYQDVWLIDVNTGERRRVLEKVRQFYGGSETGRYLLSYGPDGYTVHDLNSGATRNISGAANAGFANTEYDFPDDYPPPHGIAGWAKGDAAVLVNDKWDVWSLSPDGSAPRRLTNGATDRVVHRYAAITPRPDGIDLTRPVFFSLFGEDRKQSGWARMTDGRTVRRDVFEDARLIRLVRADSADVYAFTSETFERPPNWRVGANLASARVVSNINAFQDNHAWGRSELVNFRTAAGNDLGAVLLYPANFDPAKSYPMIVYTYEMLSRGLHNYVVPSDRSYYNFNVWSANGYFVLMPDIVYRGREPGPSALDAVESAVRTTLARNPAIDARRIGLIGHSWGGYQATFLPTRTNIFAAAVAGAPITNFLSFAGAIHWTPGAPEFSHWETGQARMDVPFWEDLDAYLRSSPAHKVNELKTPMLMMFGDADGTVDWHQGVEFYNFARRAGRTDFVMLVYPGEDHGLRKKENQVDYHRRINEWFGHWLKGEPAPKWLTDGESWLERKARIGGT